MKNDDDIESLGKIFIVSSLGIDDYTLNISYMDKSIINNGIGSKFQGRIAKSMDEIMVEESYLQHIGKGDIGQKIQLDLGDGTEREYTISGIIERENELKSYTIIPSVAFVEAITDGDPLYSVRIQLKDIERISEDSLKIYIQNIAQKWEVSEKQIVYSSYYFSQIKGLNSMQINVISILCLLIVIACSMVIYNIFYISVFAKTREYGRLRLIGTSKIQIKKMIRYESLYLSGIAIPIGLGNGCILSYILIPKGWYWPTTIFATLLITLITLISVFISTRTPGKLASNYSPIYALRITPYIYKEQKDKSRG